MKVFSVSGAATLVWLLGVTAAWCGPLRIVIDADYTVARQAAKAIELGVRVALDQSENTLGGLPVVVEPADHHGNSKRSYRTMRAVADSSDVLAIIGGLHSPPYLTYQEYLNENRLLTLLPWSAAGPVTRPEEGTENWIFRLSIDDRKAGPFLIDYAFGTAGCASVALLLVDTGWGRSNGESMMATAAQQSRQVESLHFFPPALGPAEADVIAQRIARNRADCALLVSTGVAGAELANALSRHTPQVILISHWGILGHGFVSGTTHGTRSGLRLKILQTCWLETDEGGREELEQAVAQVRDYLPPDDQSSAGADMTWTEAPAGFVHGYDLVKTLVAAAAQAAKTPEWTGDIKAKRRAIKTALEALEAPVRGILKVYDRPFGPYSPARPDAHEALGGDDLCVARMNAEGHIARIAP